MGYFYKGKYLQSFTTLLYSSVGDGGYIHLYAYNDQCRDREQNLSLPSLSHGE